jgi:prepilin-type N-terminal cleavage/methylation domain-containing protein
MKLQQTNKGFTLVELIVVITILAILGSIAFISLQGFSADARDSARSSDLKNIQTKVTTTASQGVTYTSMIDSSSTLGDFADVHYERIGGAAGDAANIDAGAINFTILGMKGDDFKDPKSGDDYVMGTTTLAGGAFELAATKEENSGTAILSGTYKGRDETNEVVVDGGGSDVTLTATGSTIVTIDSGMGVFTIGDLVVNGASGAGDTAQTAGADTNTWKVKAISSDKSKLTLVDAETGTANTALTFADNSALFLAADEAAGLIAATTDADDGGAGFGSSVAVENGSTTAFPYAQ